MCSKSVWRTWQPAGLILCSVCRMCGSSEQSSTESPCSRRFGSHRWPLPGRREIVSTSGSHRGSALPTILGDWSIPAFSLAGLRRPALGLSTNRLLYECCDFGRSVVESAPRTSPTAILGAPVVAFVRPELLSGRFPIGTINLTLDTDAQPDYVWYMLGSGLRGAAGASFHFGEKEHDQGEKADEAFGFTTKTGE